jgi:hypothetical protein
MQYTIRYRNNLNRTEWSETIEAESKEEARAAFLAKYSNVNGTILKIEPAAPGAAPPRQSAPAPAAAPATPKGSGASPARVPASQAPTSSAQRPPQRPTRASASSAASRYAARNYAALRGIASFCTGLAWIFVVLAILGGVGGVVWTISEGRFAGLAVTVVAILFGGIGYVVLRVIAEGISVLLDIEANTRRAADILDQRLH